MIRLSKYLTEILCRENIISDNDMKMYEYGFQITIANMINFVIVLLIGILSKSLLYSFMFYFVFIGMRIYCGGYHAKSYLQCFLLFSMICTFCIAITQFTITLGESVIEALTIAAFLIQGICIYKMAPLEHINKALTHEEKIIFRKRCWYTYLILGVIVATFKVYGNSNYNTVISYTLLAVSILMIKERRREL